MLAWVLYSMGMCVYFKCYALECEYMSGVSSKLIAEIELD